MFGVSYHHDQLVVEDGTGSGKCTKISNTKVSNKMPYANSADPDQTAPEQSDRGLHWLPVH